MPDKGRIKGTLADCISEGVARRLTGEIVHQEGKNMSARIIFISGEPAGAEYTDPAGTIYGDTAVLRLPPGILYTISPLPIALAEDFAARARIFHPTRLYAHAKAREEPGSREPTPGGIGTLQIRTGAGLRIELWKNGHICASDTTDAKGSVSFRLLEGTYECRLRNGISLISKTPLIYPGGDREMEVPYKGVKGE